VHTLRWKATDRAEWQRVVRHAVDTNPRSYACSVEVVLLNKTTE